VYIKFVISVYFVIVWLYIGHSIHVG